MLIECGWCRTVTGEKDGEGVTSTICISCVEKHFPEQAAEFKRQKDGGAVCG